MAILQTIFATNFSCTPNKPFTNLNIPSLSLNPQSLKCNKRSRLLPGGVKCSMDYDDNYSNNGGAVNGSANNIGLYDPRLLSAGPQYQRPAEIEWKKELANSVQLIGIVGTTVLTRQLDSGTVLARCRLAVKTSASDTTWVNLTFWNELALVAAQHVEKGNRIFVSGRFVSDTIETNDGKLQTYYKVVVQQLNFVERNLSPESSYDNSSNAANAERKLNTRPENITGSTEELWQAYFANPGEWWDNRRNKRNPKQPDFKHKDTAEALWVDSWKTPSWVKSQLELLDAKMEAYNNQNPSTSRTDFVASDFSSY